GRILREAKALVPSSFDWARGGAAGWPRFLDIARGAHRAPDPHLDLANGVIIRRLAPDVRKVERGPDFDLTLESDLLSAMGFDIGAIHAEDAQTIARIQGDLDARPDEWLHKAAKRAGAWVEDEHAHWARDMAGNGQPNS